MVSTARLRTCGLGYLGGAALLVCAVLFSLSRVHRLQDADTLLPVFISLDRWTPFYWEQDRFGTLLPLLVMPVRDYRWNAVSQTFLNVSGALIALVVIAAWTLDRDGRVRQESLAIAAFSAALIGVCLHVEEGIGGYLLLPGSPYFSSLGLLFPGLHLLRVSRGAGMAAMGFLLLLLSMWVNISNGVVGVFLALLIPRRTLVDRGVVLIGVAGAAAGSWIAARYLTGFQNYDATIPTYVAWAVFRDMLENTAGQMVYPERIFVLAAAGLAGMVMLWRWGCGFTALRVIALGAIAVSFAAVFSKLAWVYAQGAQARYWATPAFLLFSGFALAAAGAFYGLLTRMQVSQFNAGAACSGLAIAVFAAGLGVRLPAAGLQELNRAASISQEVDEQIRRSRCTILAGDYWRVWPALFLRRAAGDRTIMPVAYRMTPMLDQVKALPNDGRVYCGWCGDPEVARVASTYGVARLRQGEAHGRLCFYKSE
ncbi:MAG: hypothetical protein JNN08_01320 [Bryobacterales bacterium]|nr:hypothetical protein [Bryobacterales bacterium]